MKYKGFNIDKVSRYIFNGFDNTAGYYWNVNFNGIAQGNYSISGNGIKSF